jgi:hypothetical protein
VAEGNLLSRTKELEFWFLAFETNTPASVSTVLRLISTETHAHPCAAHRVQHWLPCGGLGDLRKNPFDVQDAVHEIVSVLISQSYWNYK